jgi:hypothetical protein
LNAITESVGSKNLIVKHELNLEKINESIYGKDTIKKAPKFIKQVTSPPERSFGDTSIDKKSFGSPSKSISKLQNREYSFKKLNLLKPPLKPENDSSKCNTPKSPYSADCVL